ncbi:uncharacterized protein SCHCODRAFT_02101315 [Schizophyllum commune H4-8]|uniref:uncharacterized protein n=1 Tax=Schizophyllum commune (strain H4-8 / FGSC 9210) TaxID=578458 RepID=UPI002160A0D6|nr:uncharacterized protein SCHCODRAFT_02101315 [Schizophyllum commune H4-8]KAI5886576.1 hypothetical protein SCHCODRAFT_02101315 [Schizophyllum commune H4-8]
MKVLMSLRSSSSRPCSARARLVRRSASFPKLRTVYSALLVSYIRCSLWQYQWLLRPCGQMLAATLMSVGFPRVDGRGPFILIDRSNLVDLTVVPYDVLIQIKERWRQRGREGAVESNASALGARRVLLVSRGSGQTHAYSPLEQPSRFHDAHLTPARPALGARCGGAKNKEGDCGYWDD